MATFFVEKNENPAPGEGKWMVTSSAGFGSKLSTHRTKSAAKQAAKKRATREGDDVASQGSGGGFTNIFQK